MAHYCPRHGGMERQRSLQILGLSRDATTEEINQSYRRLAREHHPDKNNNEPEATRKFQEINRAYQYLTKDAESSDDEFESPFHQRRRFYFDDDDDDDEPFSFFGPSIFSMFMQELLFERMIRQMFATRQAESQRRHDFHGWRHSYHDDDDLPPWARRNPPPRPSWERRSSSPRPSWERRSPSPRPSWERRSPSPRPSWERRNPSSSPSHNTNQSSRRSTWSSDSTQPSTSHDHRESSTQQNSTKRKGNQSSGKSLSSSGATKKSRRRQARKEKRLQKLIAKERRRQDEDMARRMTSMNL